MLHRNNAWIPANIWGLESASRPYALVSSGKRNWFTPSSPVFSVLATWCLPRERTELKRGLPAISVLFINQETIGIGTERAQNFIWACLEYGRRRPRHLNRMLWMIH